MSENRIVEVVGPAGLHGRVDTGRWPLDLRAEGGDAEVQVQLDDGRELMVPRGALRRLEDGRYRLEAERGVEAGGDEAAEPQGRREQIVVPVVQESVQVGKREVERGGVRVRKVAREREEVVNPPLRHEQVTIDRVAVQREVSGPMPVREEDGVVIVPLVEEVVVVRKAWVLREEIRINKRQFEVHRPRRVTLRAEEAVVERLEGPAGETTESGGEQGGAGGGGGPRVDAGEGQGG